MQKKTLLSVYTFKANADKTVPLTELSIRDRVLHLYAAARISL